MTCKSKVLNLREDFRRLKVTTAVAAFEQARVSRMQHAGAF